MSREQYKEKIIEMLRGIENMRFIRMIYGFVVALFEESEGKA